MLPDLKTGVTRAILIFSGKVPLLRDESKMYFNGTNKELNFALQCRNLYHQNQDFCHPLRRRMLFLFLHQIRLPLQKSCPIL